VPCYTKQQLYGTMHNSGAPADKMQIFERIVHQVMDSDTSRSQMYDIHAANMFLIFLFYRVQWETKPPQGGLQSVSDICSLSQQVQSWSMHELQSYGEKIGHFSRIILLGIYKAIQLTV
jgi:hypothetical protein